MDYISNKEGVSVPKGTQVEGGGAGIWTQELMAAWKEAVVTHLGSTLNLCLGPSSFPSGLNLSCFGLRGAGTFWPWGERTPSLALPHSMGPGGGAEGVGEKGQDRFHPRTPCPFPVRTARLIPNLPLSLLTGLGKPPGTQQRFPGVQAGGRAGTEAAHAETRRPAPLSGKVEAARRAPEAPDPHISAPGASAPTRFFHPPPCRPTVCYILLGSPSSLLFFLSLVSVYF